MQIEQFKIPGMFKNLFFLLALNMVVACSFAQVTITGRVSDKSGDQATGVPGITVTLKGTTNASGTDNNGLYKLSVPSKAGKYTLVFYGSRISNRGAALNNWQRQRLYFRCTIGDKRI